MVKKGHKYTNNHRKQTDYINVKNPTSMTQLVIQNCKQALGQQSTVSQNTNVYTQLPFHHCPVRINTIYRSSPTLRT